MNLLLGYLLFFNTFLTFKVIFKWQKNMVKKNKKPKSKFTCGPIHFKVFTFFLSLNQQKILYILCI